MSFGRRIHTGACRSMLLSLLGLACFVTSARAAACGDDVDGHRVACSCSDVVVSDTRLQPGDPVVAAPCSGDGLILRAPRGTLSLRLDLGGQTLRGQGGGVGLRVIGGESGVVIVGGGPGETAVVANFGVGLRASDPRSLREVRDIQFSGNARDGVRVRTVDGILADVRAEQNGRDGVRVGGRAPRLERVEANRNGRYGVFAAPRAASVDARAQHNRGGDLRDRTQLPPGEPQ